MLPDYQVEARTRTLVELAMVCHWLDGGRDVDSTRRHARAALALARAAGRDDLAAGALGALALADSSDGKLMSSLQTYELAFAQAGERHTALLTPALEMSGLILYWMGRGEESVARSRKALAASRAVNDTMNTIRALGDLGLALASCGRYAEAQQVFDEARQFGREYGIGPMLARAMAMCGGMHLDVFDYAGAEELAEEARTLGRIHAFPLPVVSGGIDLLLNFARRGAWQQAVQLVDEVVDSIQTAVGAHGWLWRMRFALALAEIALARGDWVKTYEHADDVLRQSQERNRPKYAISGLIVRAEASRALRNEHAARTDLRLALEGTRSIGDPALFIRAAAAQLSMQHDQRLAREARAAVDRVVAALPSEEARVHFLTALPVQTIRDISL
jgi:tetratricopeptide (TPR) repeat protein